MERVIAALKSVFDLIAPPRSDAMVLASYSDEALLEKFRLTSTAAGFALSSYKDPAVKALIHELKYHDAGRAAAILGRALADAVLNIIEDTELSTREIVVVPIPLSDTRERERGFNQIERVITAALVHMPGLRASSCLKKMRETAPQTKLARSKRLQNVHGAFICEPIADAHLIVVDDVMTTGATLAEAKRALRQSGAREVTLVALAH